jgi:hypothetical protein
LRFLPNYVQANYQLDLEVPDLTYLLDNGSSCSVIQSAVYGIKWAHNLQGLQDPTDNSFVHNLVETAKRQPRQPKSKKDPDKILLEA